MFTIFKMNIYQNSFKLILVSALGLRMKQEYQSLKLHCKANQDLRKFNFIAEVAKEVFPAIVNIKGVSELVIFFNT